MPLIALILKIQGKIKSFQSILLRLSDIFNQINSVLGFCGYKVIKVF